LPSNRVKSPLLKQGRGYSCRAEDTAFRKSILNRALLQTLSRAWFGCRKAISFSRYTHDKIIETLDVRRGAALLRLYNIIWNEKFVSKIEQKHGVNPDEVEEVLFSRRMFVGQRRAKSKASTFTWPTGKHRMADI
jgi:hypothetical protein